MQLKLMSSKKIGGVLTLSSGDCRIDLHKWAVVVVQYLIL